VLKFVGTKAGSIKIGSHGSYLFRKNLNNDTILIAILHIFLEAWKNLADLNFPLDSRSSPIPLGSSMSIKDMG
jgi:hypothetical protein